MTTGTTLARPIAQVRIDFDDASSGEALEHDVSAAARIGDTLFLACDETATIEVTHRTGERAFGNHSTFHLAKVFDLPDGDEELDIEGLAIDGARLWIVGSHSMTRRKPKKNKPIDAAAIARMAEVRANPNRHFLGFVPLEPAGDRRWAIGKGCAMLPVRNGRNALSKALAKDPHIAPFIGVPAKENGFDVEGIAVAENRIAIGLRGPVVNGWSCIVTFDVACKASRIELETPLPYRKHWLEMHGLGVRDLKQDGADLLILAGPTQDLDGPVRVYRWPNWRSAASRGDDCLIVPERLLDLPHGEECDHAEGLVPWPLAKGKALLVLHDSPSADRIDETADSIMGDLFAY